MHHYAQTNLQLFAQLRERGYSSEAIALIERAYWVTVKVFPGFFRASGKTLVDHLVGTASILADAGARDQVIAAGLLHAVYVFGEFGANFSGESPTKREQVERWISKDVEDLCARYTSFEWNEKTIPVIRQSVERMNALEREVLLMRLANELEDHLDLGILYCRNADERRRSAMARVGPTCEIARAAGFADLASSIEREFNAAITGTLPNVPVSPYDQVFVARPLTRWQWRMARLRQKVTRSVRHR